MEELLSMILSMSDEEIEELIDLAIKNFENEKQLAVDLKNIDK